MTAPSPLSRLRAAIFPPSDDAAQAAASANRFAVAALERHKREGMELAVRARWIALSIFAVMLPFVVPLREALYFELLILAFAVVGWFQRRAARVGRSFAEVLLILADLLLMTIAIVAPNPFASEDWPAAMHYRTEAFKYFFVFLAFGTLAYSWRTVRGMGNMTATIWLAGLAAAWTLSQADPALTEAAMAAFGDFPGMAKLLDPNNFLFQMRVQEIVVFVVVAWILAASVRRNSRLLLGQAALERERANLARYFSPNMVDQLSRNDEPLRQVRTQDVAVLFADIVGFTRFAADRDPQEVIDTLREFHKRMEAEVFRHSGTLDKYLGDGLMATFGTPVAGATDALNALLCARAMIASIAAWNLERAAEGQERIRAGFGLHYGPAVLGDIGVNRLEFTVIGNTVNVASRVEALTRTLNVELAATDDLVTRAKFENGGAGGPMSELEQCGEQEIRGLDHKVAIWRLTVPGG